MPNPFRILFNKTHKTAPVARRTVTTTSFGQTQIGLRHERPKDYEEMAAIALSYQDAFCSTLLADRTTTLDELGTMLESLGGIHPTDGDGDMATVLMQDIGPSAFVFEHVRVYSCLAKKYPESFRAGNCLAWTNSGVHIDGMVTFERIWQKWRL